MGTQFRAPPNRPLGFGELLDRFLTRLESRDDAALLDVWRIAARANVLCEGARRAEDTAETGHSKHGEGGTDCLMLMQQFVERAVSLVQVAPPRDKAWLAQAVLLSRVSNAILRHVIRQHGQVGIHHVIEMMERAWLADNPTAPSGIDYLHGEVSIYVSALKALHSGQAAHFDIGNLALFFRASTYSVFRELAKMTQADDALALRAMHVLAGLEEGQSDMAVRWLSDATTARRLRDAISAGVFQKGGHLARLLAPIVFEKIATGQWKSTHVRELLRSIDVHLARAEAPPGQHALLMMRHVIALASPSTQHASPKQLLKEFARHFNGASRHSSAFSPASLTWPKAFLLQYAPYIAALPEWWQTTPQSMPPERLLLIVENVMRHQDTAVVAGDVLDHLAYAAWETCETLAREAKRDESERLLGKVVAGVLVYDRLATMLSRVSDEDRRSEIEGTLQDVRRRLLDTWHATERHIHSQETVTWYLDGKLPQDFIAEHMARTRSKRGMRLWASLLLDSTALKYGGAITNPNLFDAMRQHGVYVRFAATALGRVCRRSGATKGRRTTQLAPTNSGLSCADVLGALAQDGAWGDDSARICRKFQEVLSHPPDACELTDEQTERIWRNLQKAHPPCAARIARATGRALTAYDEPPKDTAQEPKAIGGDTLSYTTGQHTERAGRLRQSGRTTRTRDCPPTF